MSEKKRISNAEPAAPKEPVKTAGYCIYVGPSLRGIIQTRTIIAGSKEEAIKRLDIAMAIKQRPAIKEFIVDGLNYHETMAQINVMGSDLYKKYRGLVINS
jgi:hypothetical protein